MDHSRRAFAMKVAAASVFAMSRTQKAAALSSPALLERPGYGVFNPLSYGAKGDGRTKDTVALQKAIDSCAATGGGMVYLAPGRKFLAGTLVLKPHVEFHLAGGSQLIASPHRDDFRQWGSLLFALNSSDIHISGTGEIDGNFKAFFPPKGPNGYSIPQPFLGPYDPLYERTNLNPADGRPRMILLVGCRNVLLEQFTIRDSPTWTIHPVGCDGVRITGISILNDLDVPNCDGIDVDHCRNVRIDGCNITAGDDCIILKASRNFGQYGPCEGITVTNCTLESSSAGIKIETEGAFPLRSAVISNCSIVRSNRGIRFLNRDGAIVEDILFTDLTIDTKMRPMMWWGSGEPLALSSVPRVKDGPAGEIRGVAFVNMLCRSENGVYLRGSETAPLRDIRFQNIDLDITKITAYPGGFYDMRPGDTFGESGLDRRKNAGFFAANVDGLSINGMRVTWAPGAPSCYGSALELHGCENISMAQVTGKGAHDSDTPAVFDRSDVRENHRPAGIRVETLHTTRFVRMTSV